MGEPLSYIQNSLLPKRPVQILSSCSRTLTTYASGTSELILCPIRRSELMQEGDQPCSIYLFCHHSRIWAPFCSRIVTTYHSKHPSWCSVLSEGLSQFPRIRTDGTETSEKSGSSLCYGCRTRSGSVLSYNQTDRTLWISELKFCKLLFQTPS